MQSSVYIIDKHMFELNGYLSIYDHISYSSKSYDKKLITTHFPIFRPKNKNRNACQ